MAASNTAEPMNIPNAEELRMVRAIALLAVLDAARFGDYHATFHGFRVQALRQVIRQGTRAFVRVTLCVSLGSIVDCARVTVAMPQPTASADMRGGEPSRGKL